MSEYTIKRTISDVEFGESHVEEIRESVKHELVEEGKTNLKESTIERRTKERLLEIAEDQTLMNQGDCRLHTEISHELDE